MKLQRLVPIAVAAFAAFLCVSCIDLVVSLDPWFDVDDSAIADPRLAGSWCLDDEDGDCSGDERMQFVPGPEESWNVLINGKLRYRVWLGEIDKVRYLNWMFLCEPSRGTADDDCRELDFPLGSHLLTRITLQEDDRIEFRLLEAEPFADLLEDRGQPLEYGKAETGLVVLADSEALRELVFAHGGQYELWSEETMEMTRLRADRAAGR